MPPLTTDQDGPIRRGGLHDQHERGAEQDGLDPAKVKAEHAPQVRHPDYCNVCAAARWPCLPYRLADLALERQAKLDRILDLVCDWSPRASRKIIEILGSEATARWAVESSKRQRERNASWLARRLNRRA